MVVPSDQAVLISPCELPSEVEVVHPSICQVPQLKMLTSAKCVSKTLKPWSKCREEWRCASCPPPSPWPELRRSLPRFSKTPHFVCWHPWAQELASSAPWRRRGQNRIQLQRGKHQRQNFHSSRTCFFLIEISLLHLRSSLFEKWAVDVVAHNLHGKQAAVHHGNSDRPRIWKLWDKSIVHVVLSASPSYLVSGEVVSAKNP